MNMAGIEATSLLDAMPDAIVITDTVGRILYLNKAFEKLLGYGHDETVGKPIDIVLPASVRKAHRHYMADFSHNPRKMQMGTRPVLSAVNKAGEEVPVSISLGSLDWAGKKCLIAVLRDASSVQLRIGEVLAQAERDPLTGLGNRGHLLRQLDAARGNGPFGLLYIDLSKFKPFNDRYGHAFGDEVIKIVARRIHSTVRASDVSARIGGDEFAVILTSLSDAIQLEARACSVARAIKAPFTIGKIKGHVAANIGGVLSGHDAKSAAQLLECADLAMYKAKHSGRTYGLADCDQAAPEPRRRFSGCR